MKKIVISLTLLFSAGFANGQINMVRYNDNFSSLKNDTIPKKGLEKIKYLRISNLSNISFGGELREQFQYYHNQNFGDVPASFAKVSTGQLWHRAMVHTNIEMGSKFRIFAQMGSTFRFLNPNPAAPEIDENQLSLHQAFIDYRFQKSWIARMGRQEISYANHRLFTFREGPNTRLAFDAAAIKYISKNRKIDLFAMSPVISKKGVFDDESFKDFIVGIYGTEKITSKAILLDYYVLNFNSDRRRYNYVAGKERRQTYGFRVFSENTRFNYELEASYQSGRFNQSDISAFGISADIHYRLESEINFIAGIGSNYMSGDKSNNDRQINTYNLLFSKPQYGLTAPIGVTNLININPNIKINPTKKSSIYVSSYFMWRQSNQDGTYSPAAVELRPSQASIFISRRKEIGTLFTVESIYSHSRNLSFGLDASRFLAGRYVKETGKGKNISYLSFKGSYKF